LIAKRTSID
ncbi:unnamed protein product, partial [Allacma fusca]